MIRRELNYLLFLISTSFCLVFVATGFVLLLWGSHLIPGSDATLLRMGGGAAAFVGGVFFILGRNVYYERRAQQPPLFEAGAGNGSTPPSNPCIRDRVALIVKGGGVKGLAFASAVETLEKHYEFTEFVGTSAGAITSVLLASGYSGAELLQELRNKPLRALLDNPFQMLCNVCFLRQGLHSGERIVTWIDDLLHTKLRGDDIFNEPIKLHELPKQAVVYACQAGVGTIEFNSGDKDPRLDASFAVRCSISIPLFFVPKELGNRFVYDGGLLNNFPLQKYLSNKHHTEFIALYLWDDKPGPPGRRRKTIWKDLLNIWIERDDRVFLDKYRDSCVLISTFPIGTTDFRMNDDDRRFLQAAGRAAAFRFLAKNGKIPESNEDYVRATRESRLLQDVVDRRRRRKRGYIQAAAALILFILILLFTRPNLFWAVAHFPATILRFSS